MSLCNILDNLPALWRDSLGLRISHTLDLVRNTACRIYTLLQSVRVARAGITRQFGSIFGESQRLIYTQALGSTIPGCNILCYPNILIFRNLHSLYNCIVLGLIRDIMSPKVGKRLFSVPFYISIPLAILNLNTMVEVSLVNQCYGLTLHSVPAIISSVKRGGGAMNISTSQIVHHTGYESSYIPLADRREVLRRDSNSCQFCGKKTKMLCHDVPKCRGGKTESRNLLACCEHCRREKEEFTVPEYLALRVAQIDFPTEVKSMHIKVIFASDKEVEGIVDNLPTPETKAFWLRYPGNGARELIYTMPGMRIIELGGGEQQCKKH